MCVYIHFRPTRSETGLNQRLLGPKQRLIRGLSAAYQSTKTTGFAKWASSGSKYPLASPQKEEE